MKYITKILATLSVALCVLIIQGCDSGYDCSLNNIAYNRIKFYNINQYGDETEYTLAETLTVSMMINGRSEIVVNNVTNTNELTLPVSYTNECDTIILNFLDQYNDTLYIGHENIPIYQSMECGVIMHHRVTGGTNTGYFIDSMAINNANINFDYNENIKLYFTE
jgi:hypothetical protein